MKHYIIAALVIAIPSIAVAADFNHDRYTRSRDGHKIIRIDVGGQSATVDELIERVRYLEQAVYDLQNKCYDMPQVIAVPEEPQVVWTCSVKAMGDAYYGQGRSRGLAEKDAMEKCAAARGNSFFCRMAECTNQ